MALTNVGVAENVGASGADVVITLPGGTTTGDVVYVAYGIGATANQDMVMLTADYAEISDVVATGGDANLGVFRKIMGGTPDTTAQVEGRGDADTSVAAVCQVWRGADQTTPEDATATSALSENGAAIVTVTAGAVVISAVAVNNADATVTCPSGYSNQVDAAQSDTESIGVGMASILKAAAGSEDPGAWTIDTSGGVVSVTLAIRPAVAVVVGQGLTRSKKLHRLRLAA
jgi:hypothetical protein